ncbi:hypothetical protein [Winogradskyella sp.]|uniref:hypothetical protein n=1 Tax=Winogradskyella sp. TaxID=1883156 RepID=UPI003BA92FFA
MNKRQIILLILGIVLVVSGTMVLVLLHDVEQRHLLGGGLIGGGIGLMMGLFKKKKK